MIIRKCSCGHEFRTSDIKPPLFKAAAGFFGGRVTSYSDIKCGCGAACRLYIRPDGQTWEVVGAELLEKRSSKNAQKKLR